VVTRATTVARLLYASPAWWGLTTAADRSKLDRFLLITQRMGFLSESAPNMPEMVYAAEDGLLRAVGQNTSHVLRSLFPPTITRRPGLRPRPHDFELPPKDDKNFIPRILYKTLSKNKQINRK